MKINYSFECKVDLEIDNKDKIIVWIFSSQIQLYRFFILKNDRR